MVSGNLCKADGCHKILFSSYCQKHQVCRECRKAVRVHIQGNPGRWCQQCARFHPLTAFEGMKRTCREKLALMRQRRLAANIEAAEHHQYAASALHGGRHSTQTSSGFSAGSAYRFLPKRVSDSAEQEIQQLLMSCQTEAITEAGTAAVGFNTQALAHPVSPVVAFQASRGITLAPPHASPFALPTSQMRHTTAYHTLPVPDSSVQQRLQARPALDQVACSPNVGSRDPCEQVLQYYTAAGNNHSVQQQLSYPAPHHTSSTPSPVSPSGSLGCHPAQFGATNRPPLDSPARSLSSAEPHTSSRSHTTQPTGPVPSFNNATDMFREFAAEADIINAAESMLTPTGGGLLAALPLPMYSTQLTTRPAMDAMFCARKFNQCEKRHRGVSAGMPIPQPDMVCTNKLMTSLSLQLADCLPWQLPLPLHEQLQRLVATYEEHMHQ